MEAAALVALSIFWSGLGVGIVAINGATSHRSHATHQWVVALQECEAAHATREARHACRVAKLQPCPSARERYCRDVDGRVWKGWHS